jgi:hypothetical protein
LIYLLSLFLSGRHFFRKRPPDVGEGHSRKKCLFLLYHITVDTGNPKIDSTNKLC